MAASSSSFHPSASPMQSRSHNLPTKNWPEYEFSAISVRRSRKVTSPASLSASMVSASDHLSSLRLFLLLIDPYQNYCGWSSSQPFPGRETAPPCSPPSLSLSPTPPWTPPALLTLPRQPLHWGGVNFLASAGNTNQERICSCIWFFCFKQFHQIKFNSLTGLHHIQPATFPHWLDYQAPQVSKSGVCYHSAPDCQFYPFSPGKDLWGPCSLAGTQKGGG